MSKARELSKLPNYVLSTVAELKLAVGKEQGDKAFIGGYYADGDGGGGDFYWDAVSVEADNGGTIFQVTGTTTGRWKRIYGSSQRFEWWGADRNGIVDSTLKIIEAIEHFSCFDTSNATFLIDTFSTTMTSGTLCAIHVTSSLKVIGNGIFNSNTVSVSNSIFGVDSADGTIDFEIEGLYFAGTVGYRAVYIESTATLNTVKISNVNTSKQGILATGYIKKSIRITNNKVGNDIEATTAISPSIQAIIPVSSVYNPEYVVEGNYVRTGTQAIGGAFVIHGIPMGGRCNHNTHNNIGNVGDNDGFDIDNIGRFAQIIGNSAIGSGFEYKPGTNGYSDSRDIIFSHNISVNAKTPFSIRSSCIGYGNIAYNPLNYGIFCSPGADVDNLLPLATIQIHGFRIIYAGGSPWTAAVKIDGVMRGMEFEGIRIEIDPEWAVANPSGTLPNVQFNIDGDINNLTIRNSFIDKSAGNQIQVRPTTRISNLNIDNVQFGDCGDSCIDLFNCDAVRIINPVFPSTITDRPIRLSTCDRVKIECDYHSLITLAQTSGTNTGVLINNWGQEAAGAATPPNATSRWPIGCTVQNTSDGSVWVRVSVSTVPATAWKQIA
jgi:hypothetical protein